MLQTHLLLAIAWIFYCVLHSVLASQKVKAAVQKAFGKNFRLYRFFYTIFSFLGLAAILVYQFSIASTLLFQPQLAVRIIGLILMAVGGTIMLMMIWKYFMQLSGVRWLFQQEVRTKLEISGMHRIVRHPLYLGTFTFIWGWFLVSPFISFLIAAGIITIYTLIGLQYEEQKLIKEFGDDYLEYQKKVPKLIPKRFGV